MNCKVMVINIILSKKWLIRLGIWSIALFGSLFFTSLYPNEKNIFFYILMFSCVSTPFVFSNRVAKNRLLQKIIIKLDYDAWEFYVVKNECEEKYKLDDIKSYSITNSSNGNSAKFFFESKKINNLKNFRFAILYKKMSEDQTDTQEVVQSFQSMINDYNKIVDITQQIVLTPTFADSIYGLISIYVLSGLLIVAIIIHIIYHQISTLPFSLLLGGGALLRIIGQRQSAIKRRKGCK